MPEPCNVFYSPLEHSSVLAAPSKALDDLAWLSWAPHPYCSSLFQSTIATLIFLGLQQPKLMFASLPFALLFIMPGLHYSPPPPPAHPQPHSHIFLSFFVTIFYSAWAVLDLADTVRGRIHRASWPHGASILVGDPTVNTQIEYAVW